MNLKKTSWTVNDGREFNNYLESLKREDKISWSQNLLKTNLPVLALTTATMKDIVKIISQGNFLSFLDLNLNTYYENTIINAHLLTKIQDFDKLKYYLDIYVKSIDNWASCDTLTFNIKGKEEAFFQLALTYIKSKAPFIRRVGLLIFFYYLKQEAYLPQIFETMNSLKKEEHYYVNMMNAWLLCECFIQQKEKTLEFLKTHTLNKFTINKGISKCRDSRRVLQTDKDMLIRYRKKSN